MVAAAQLLQPGKSKNNHDARAGLLVVQLGQQSWAGWGGAGIAIIKWLLNEYWYWVFELERTEPANELNQAGLKVNESNVSDRCGRRCSRARRSGKQASH